MLSGKVAFITGSTRGIGWAVAETFARNHATVILNGRSDEKVLQERVEFLKRIYRIEASGLFCDVSDPSAINGAYQFIFKTYRRLDVLVNNAGILEDALLGMISDESIARTFSINALAIVYHLQAASRLMARNKSGSVVNVSSIIGVTGNAGQVVYGGAKAAVIGMTRSAAKELAPSNIRVNAVAPGFIDTDMVKQLQPDKFQERLKSIKMGRIGKPEDVANAILFLASDLSSYVTGQVIGVDGGMLI
jgi:3-oxoacyl-[acyl-carrier protein] reductase